MKNRDPDEQPTEIIEDTKIWTPPVPSKLATEDRIILGLLKLAVLGGFVALEVIVLVALAKAFGVL